MSKLVQIVLVPLILLVPLLWFYVCIYAVKREHGVPALLASVVCLFIAVPACFLVAPLAACLFLSLVGLYDYFASTYLGTIMFMFSVIAAAGCAAIDMRILRCWNPKSFLILWGANISAPIIVVFCIFIIGVAWSGR